MTFDSEPNATVSVEVSPRQGILVFEAGYVFFSRFIGSTRSHFSIRQLALMESLNTLPLG